MKVLVLLVSQCPSPKKALYHFILYNIIDLRSESGYVGES